MRLTDLDPEMIVKVGAELGVGYFFAGRLKNMNFKEVSTNLYKGVVKTFTNQVELFKQKRPDQIDKKVMAKLNNAFNAMDKFVPVDEREIVDTFESIAEPGVLAVIVTGGGVGSHWMVDETPRPVKVLDTKGAYALLGAIYEEPTNQLEQYYIQLYKGTYREPLQTFVSIIDRIEKQLTPGICRMTRQCAVKAICFDKDGNQIADTIEVDRAIRILKGEKVD